ncbi:UNVERIFIED_CONTAM: hypothetical protein PYX00_008576 [Menopon gallinae]|uniref:Uncharacterized protein n=1 Tax=Menopon gallinae TaxID=328185 RepID=A0AAW2HPX5_9NEOP
MVPAAAREEATEARLHRGELPRLRRDPVLHAEHGVQGAVRAAPADLPGHQPSQRLPRPALQGAMVSGKFLGAVTPV